MLDILDVVKVFGTNQLIGNQVRKHINILFIITYILVFI